MRWFVLLLLALVILGCVGENVEKVDPHDILLKAEKTMKSVNLDANATFELILQSPKFKDYTRYDMRIIKNGNVTKIFFLNYTYNTTDEALADVHKKMAVALRNAWILDKGERFYVHTPNLLYIRDKAREYESTDSLPRYEFLPIVTCLDLAGFFDRAKNVDLVEENEKCYVISYLLQYPDVKFAKVANVKVWISKKDYIPIKAEMSANFGQTSIKIVTKFDSYKTKV